MPVPGERSARRAVAELSRRRGESELRLPLADAVAGLEGLGSAGEVASFLESSGVRGASRRCLHGCALALDLSVVTGQTVVVAPQVALDDRTRVELGPVLREFVYRFDSGQYPSLER